ncbi:MAG: hypothetical protein Hyperionvirus31_8 [Hyperionvirus sp.]|uniref:Uncharacterized protein n=1 Tax=Hyperionvirus sp. TaxID=2487770 RepID=A0A3G5ABJ9_9VIRU|nr:MAG: hypothetical protein Hyperionvirus31_8 [Hyperionvirus sp.]
MEAFSSSSLYLLIMNIAAFSYFFSHARVSKVFDFLSMLIECHFIVGFESARMASASVVKLVEMLPIFV